MSREDVTDNEILSMQLTVDSQIGQRFAALAPAPAQLRDTGLEPSLLADLASKLLQQSGSLSLDSLAGQLGLPSDLADRIVENLRDDARVVSRASVDGLLTHSLTERGRALAAAAFTRDSYVGVAPVTLADYSRLVLAQTLHRRAIHRGVMRRALAGLILSEEMLDQLGAALNSGRAMFLHGASGTGKTSVAARLSALFTDEVLIPHALLVCGSIVRVFDPKLHARVAAHDSLQQANTLWSFDARYVRCARPVVHVSGELEPGMLELQRCPATQELQAPLQLRANNGLMILDDLGRQKGPVEPLLNRWIAPLQNGQDYLSFNGSVHFSVPFDVQLVLITDREPRQLADDAMLRRLGYKIHFEAVSRGDYRAIWEEACASLQLPFEPELVEFALNELHGSRGVQLLPCHPRQLMSMALDHLRYDERELRLTRDALSRAWNNYFLQSR
jgi:predicted ATPase with chaperone activity